MKKIISIIIVLLLATLSVCAQTAKKHVVHLTNGVKIIGIVDKHSEGYVVVTTDTGDVFYYLDDEIQKITEIKDKSDKKNKDFSKINTQYKNRGYYGTVNFRLQLIYPSIETIHGYRFSNYFTLGIGVGASLMGFPLYVHMSSEFMKTKVTPYISFECGANLRRAEEISGISNIDAGIVIRLKKGALQIGVGCHILFEPVILPDFNIGYRFSL